MIIYCPSHTVWLGRATPEKIVKLLYGTPSSTGSIKTWVRVCSVLRAPYPMCSLWNSWVRNRVPPYVELKYSGLARLIMEDDYLHRICIHCELHSVYGSFVWMGTAEAIKAYDVEWLSSEDDWVRLAGRVFTHIFVWLSVIMGDSQIYDPDELPQSVLHGEALGVPSNEIALFSCCPLQLCYLQSSLEFSWSRLGRWFLVDDGEVLHTLKNT